ncbi:hypothetical protein [Crocosphaera chwakensis]|uniref:Uncharacterized protein n=1 Tax=Crocosphaera chwakensis CCY0110 TaxID=391612 RepID=A3IYS7_9CHRO|nr:hypothetical protein [Crocosphaera chwakensis]EAZ88368.1 hypothetical protein CY0110_04348 [Crocosphaera chwakensis CCY0110]
MNNNFDQPKKYDAVLGGNNPPPIDGVVLGGIEGLKSRLASNNIQSQISALSEALNYGEVGLDLVIDALSNYRREVRKNAYQLLQQREEKKAKVAVSNYKFWSDFEYLNRRPYEHAKTFASRKVEDFYPETGIIDPINIAYALRIELYQEDDPEFQAKFSSLINMEKVSQLEALVIGCWGYEYNNSVMNILINANLQLSSIKALFIGDIEDKENMISSIKLGDINPILRAYPNLELLHIRGGRGLRFSSDSLKKHDKLKAIRIESGGLPREAINNLCALNLPALEYLELLIGTDYYGGNSTIEDLMPIIKGEAFPNLKYLGLRNAEYTDEIVFELVKSPFLEDLIELDLSLGTLGIEGAEALLNCSAINELDTLNISKNWLRGFPETINQLLQLDCEVIIGAQGSYDPNKQLEEEEDAWWEYCRYCSVRE